MSNAEGRVDGVDGTTSPAENTEAMRRDLADKLAQLLASDKEPIEYLKIAIQNMIDELDPDRKVREAAQALKTATTEVNAALTRAGATPAPATSPEAPAAPEAIEKPEALKVMIADMERTANAENKFYNFGTLADMRAALNSLPEATVQDIVQFADKLKGRRTEKSFPVLVNSADGNSYLLTESAPSKKHVGIHLGLAVSDVCRFVRFWLSWGIASPNSAQWNFLRKLGLVDQVDVCKEWLPLASRDEWNCIPFGFAYQPSVVYPASWRVDEYLGVRALKELSKT
jgi:hypothetical protein